jgi:hypothetical protein
MPMGLTGIMVMHINQISNLSFLSGIDMGAYWREKRVFGLSPYQ